VLISVQDNGIGIDNSEISRIFEPFYRSPAVSSVQIHGTGLGLPLAKSIAEAMGGKLSVHSEIGKGSVFILHLPIPEEETILAATASSSA
jgi:signal transduction histidine kinase